MSAPERIPPRGVTATDKDGAGLLAQGELTVRGRIREASNAVVAARIATVFPAPTSPVMTPMWCCSMHQVIRATASAWERWRCSIPGARSRPNGILVNPK